MRAVAARSGAGRRRRPPPAGHAGTDRRPGGSVVDREDLRGDGLPQRALRCRSRRLRRRPPAGPARPSARPRRRTPRIRWASSDSAVTRVIRTSRSVGGSRSPGVPAPDASSSSTKNGLPSARRSIASSSSRLGRWPRIAPICASSSERPNRPTRCGRPCGRRSISDSHGRSGWRRFSSSVRYVPTTASRSVRALRARNDRTSRVELSDQCRSSTTRRTGTRSPSDRRRTSSPSKIRAWTQPGRSNTSGSGAATAPSFGHQPPEIARLEHPQLVDVADRAGLAGGDHRRQAAERLDDRGERQPLAVAERDAAALEHKPAALSGRVRDFRHEPRLADAGIAADERDDGVTGGAAHHRVR